MADNLNTMA